MRGLIVPKDYKAIMDIYHMQKAIGLIHSLFERALCNALNLKRVSAPLFVDSSSGLNDNLNGVERPVSFDIPDTLGEAEVVHSLAKWKRQALKDYDFHVGKGLYTDMNAIRRDEVLDNIHSIYVDQWDWEKVIPKSKRNEQYLKKTVRSIVNAICDTEEILREIFSELNVLPSKKRRVKFITSQELLDLYPNLDAKQREREITKKYKTVFLMKIGGKLSDGKPHDGRAPDYDDWELNGDILFWNDILDDVLEISSMGIRVDADTLRKQLKISGCEDRAKLPFHKNLLEGELPQTIGGGIGQSRLCMLLLGCAHIGEVQSSIWDEKMREECKQSGIFLL